MTTWRYVGHEGTPDQIRLGGQNIARGATIELQDDYDFAAEYGEDVRVALFVIRISPPPSQLRPLVSEGSLATEIPDALESWQQEMVKTKGRRRGMLQDG